MAADHTSTAQPRTAGRLHVESSQLRRAGLKVTIPRVKILDILASPTTLRHMSAEDVYRRLLDMHEDIGLATVYRVLTQFESAGIVTRHHFEGGTAVFELNEGVHHDHIVCSDCGRVEEFSDDSIEDRQELIATRLGFKLTDHSLTLHGHCVRVNCPHRVHSAK
jgi:Fur family ferric uptake transcriptional regulator